MAAALDAIPIRTSQLVSDELHVVPGLKGACASTTVHYANGIDGLHLAMESTYDLVILDSMLPRLDGLSLLAALRQS